MVRTLFVSDLHLEESRPEITRAFFRLLDRFYGQVERRFILGDFFEMMP
jgi:UDP-2,3-diacylglucosamine hydrolase